MVKDLASYSGARRLVMLGNGARPGLRDNGVGKKARPTTQAEMSGCRQKPNLTSVLTKPKIMLVLPGGSRSVSCFRPYKDRRRPSRLSHSGNTLNRHAGC